MENQKLVNQKTGRQPLTSDHPAIPTKRTDRKYQEVCELLAAHPRIFARQGAVVAAWRLYEGRTYGPYFSMVYRESGRQRWVYLGKSPELAQKVRRLLEELQAPLRRRRALTRLRRAATGSLRDCRAQLNGELAKIGLHLQGYEIRGWRNGKTQPPQRTQGERRKRVYP